MPQIDRVRSQYSGLTGLPGVSTMYFNPLEGLNPQDLVDRIRAFWDSMKTVLSDDLTIVVEPIVDSIDSDTNEITSSTAVTPPGAVVGQDTADLLPRSTQLLVQLRTGVFFGGRELRGRYFIPGQCENHNELGKPLDELITFTQSRAQSLADDADQIVYSPTKFEYADVSTTPVWTEWAVLRSRRD